MMTLRSIIALLTGKTRKELSVSFRKMISELEEIGWDIGEGALLRTYLVISTGEPKFSKARKILMNLMLMKLKST